MVDQAVGHIRLGARVPCEIVDLGHAISTCLHPQLCNLLTREQNLSVEKYI